MEDLCISLLDNGSLSPNSVLGLRRLAEGLSLRIGRSVAPVSMFHSDKVDESIVEGQAAELWASFLKRKMAAGFKRFLVVPLFFGPSSMIVKRAPAVGRSIEVDGSSPEFAFAKTLVDLDDEIDDELARIVADLVIQKLDTSKVRKPTQVVLVDHGSPSDKVNRCRNLVAAQMNRILGDRVASVTAASMERREGIDYDFNEPLLERALDLVSESGMREVVLSYLFLFPGRHAGDGGDIDQICEESKFAKDGTLFKCDLLGKQPALIDLLERRLKDEAALQGWKF